MNNTIRTVIQAIIEGGNDYEYNHNVLTTLRALVMRHGGAEGKRAMIRGAVPDLSAPAAEKSTARGAKPAAPAAPTTRRWGGVLEKKTADSGVHALNPNIKRRPTVAATSAKSADQKPNLLKVQQGAKEQMMTPPPQAPPLPPVPANPSRKEVAAVDDTPATALTDQEKVTAFGMKPGGVAKTYGGLRLMLTLQQMGVEVNESWNETQLAKALLNNLQPKRG